MKTILYGKEEVKNLLDSIGGEFFRVSFIKRTTGELREMTCRKGVKKHLQGGEAAYSFSEKGLISVYDVQSEGYRCIPIENVLEIEFGGVKYQRTDLINRLMTDRVLKAEHGRIE